jgi:acetamidase/formamidase
MDIRDMAEGTELFLPVEVAGGLFSVGDTHAAQGDGEICGTAIESQMDIALKFDLVKQAGLPYPRFFVPSRGPDPRGRAGWDATTGIGPDLMTGTRDAVKGMIDLLCRRHNLSAVEAYMLCSVAGDLKISEVVDQPNWVVSFYFPRAVFE